MNHARVYSRLRSSRLRYKKKKEKMEKKTRCLHSFFLLSIQGIIRSSFYGLRDRSGIVFPTQGSMLLFKMLWQKKRSAPPSALCIIHICFIHWKYWMFVSCNSGAVLRASPSSGPRIVFSFGCKSRLGTFRDFYRCVCVLCSPLNWP